MTDPAPNIADGDTPTGMSSAARRRRRRIVCAVAWAGCVPGLAGYGLLSLGALGAAARGGEGDASTIAFVYLSFLCGWFAWYALAAMSKAWLADRPLAPGLPTAGTVAAGIALVPLASHGWPLVLVSPGILLACWLVVWHLRAHGLR